MSIVARDKLPTVLKYGTARELIMGVKQKYRLPDIGANSYQPTDCITFKPEYGVGNQYFLDTNEIYMDFQLMPTDSGSNPGYSLLYLDYCTDALFEKLCIQMGSTQVEELLEYNRFMMFWNDYCNMATPYICSTTTTSTAATMYLHENTTSGVATAINTTSTVSGDTVTSFTPTITSVSSSFVSNPNDQFFGKDPTKRRTGLAMVSGTTYNLAWHLKSFIFGKWSDNLFPLFMSPMINIELYLDNCAQSCISPMTPYNQITTTTNNVTSTASYASTNWSYDISTVKLHYTLLTMSNETRGLVGTAYTSSNMFDIMNSTILYQYMATSINSAITRQQLQLQIPIKSLKQIITILQRNNDENSFSEYSLTNNIGNITKVQTTIGSIKRPEIEATIQYRPYELYRTLAQGLGEPNYSNGNFPMELQTDSSSIASGGNSFYTPQKLTQNSSLGYSTLLTGGAVGANVYGSYYSNGSLVSGTSGTYYTITPTDYWNAACEGVHGSRSNFVWLTNLEDANIFDNHKMKGGVDVSGSINILFDFEFVVALPMSVKVHNFFLYDAHLSIEGAKVDMLKAELYQVQLQNERANHYEAMMDEVEQVAPSFNGRNRTDRTS